MMKYWNFCFLSTTTCLLLLSDNLQAAVLSSLSSKSSHHHSHIHTLSHLDLSPFSPNLFPELTDKQSYQIASVCFITDAGNCSGDKFGNLESPTGGSGGGTPNGNDDNIPEYETIPEQCRNAGYTVTSCVAGKHPVNPCPSDNTYYKECVCNENLTQTCSVPYYGVGVSCDGKYASCQRDDNKACRNAGYTQTASCPTLQVPNKKCPYNASYYDKCVCQSGLVTCSSPQIGVGTSCGGKYQSCQCPSSYKSCDCGGAVGASSCTINGQTTYSSCKSCCSDTCPSGYSKTNPGGCYEVSRTECGTMCYKSKSCCDSSSSDWCPVHSTCHGDCCKDGTLQPCDTKCGGSGCSSSGSSGSSSGSGSGSSSESGSSSGSTCSVSAPVTSTCTASCSCSLTDGGHGPSEMSKQYYCDCNGGRGGSWNYIDSNKTSYDNYNACLEAKKSMSECSGSSFEFTPPYNEEVRCGWRCLD